MRRMSFVTVLLVLMIATGAFAMKGSADVVKVAPVQAAVSATAGQRIDFDINVNIDKKWHLYAHGDTNFIGVDLETDEKFPLQDFKAEYPTGHQKEFFGEMVFMIEGKNVIKASALVPDSLAKGEHVLNLSVTAQACDDKTCLAPAYIPVSLKLTVE
jgi:Thiol:disulfide interchange protein DsbD, N-terminal